MEDLTKLAWTRTDPDGHRRTQTDRLVLLGSAGFCWVPLWVPLGSAGFRWVPLGSAGFRWVPLGSAGFYYTDVFNDRLLGANLQLVPGCHTLAA